MAENVGGIDIDLTESDLREIEDGASRITASGDRYPTQHQRLINRWGWRRGRWARLSSAMRVFVSRTGQHPESFGLTCACSAHTR